MGEEGLSKRDTAGINCGGSIGIILSIPFIMFIFAVTVILGCVVIGGSFAGASYFAVYIDENNDETVICDREYESIVREITPNYIILFRVSNSDEFTMEIPSFSIFTGQTVNVYRKCTYDPCLTKDTTYTDCDKRHGCQESDYKHFWEPPQSDIDCGAATAIDSIMFLFSFIFLGVVVVIIVVVTVVLGAIILFANMFACIFLSSLICGLLIDYQAEKEHETRNDDIEMSDIKTFASESSESKCVESETTGRESS